MPFGLGGSSYCLCGQVGVASAQTMKTTLLLRRILYGLASLACFCAVAQEPGYMRLYNDCAMRNGFPEVAYFRYAEPGDLDLAQKKVLVECANKASNVEFTNFVQRSLRRDFSAGKLKEPAYVSSPSLRVNSWIEEPKDRGASSEALITLGILIAISLGMLALAVSRGASAGPVTAITASLCLSLFVAYGVGTVEGRRYYQEMDALTLAFAWVLAILCLVGGSLGFLVGRDRAKERRND